MKANSVSAGASPHHPSASTLAQETFGFAVQEDSLSSSLRKEQERGGGAIRRFKIKHDIWTYRAKGMERKEQPWCALWMERARKLFTENIANDPLRLICEYCVFLEEKDLLVYGEGELTAIRTLCERNGIKCEL